MSDKNGSGAAPPQNETTEEAQRGADGRWQEGQSGNPAGRPPKIKSLTAALEGLVDKDELAQCVWDIATGKISASVQVRLEAVKYIYARIEGNPIQAMRHQIEGAVGPLIFLHPGRVAPDVGAGEPSPNGASDAT